MKIDQLDLCKINQLKRNRFIFKLLILYLQESDSQSLTMNNYEEDLLLLKMFTK